MKYIKGLLWLLVFLVMAVIYNFSAQPASASDKASKNITKKIVNILPQTKKLPEDKKQEKIKNMDGTLRKFAHFILFFILGIVVFLALLVNLNFSSIWRLWAVCLVICILYAAFDEAHQLFVDGRSAEVRDIAIDFTGSFTGSGLIMLILKK
ncbi:MAG: VanZ family protein [Eubacteriales bacterium]|nr:VanZ family protein [Eubacteriales bacterium]